MHKSAIDIQAFSNRFGVKLGKFTCTHGLVCARASPSAGKRVLIGLLLPGVSFFILLQFD